MIIIIPTRDSRRMCKDVWYAVLADHIPNSGFCFAAIDIVDDIRPCRKCLVCNICTKSIYRKDSIFPMMAYGTQGRSKATPFFCGIYRSRIGTCRASTQIQYISTVCNSLFCSGQNLVLRKCLTRSVETIGGNIDDCHHAWR